MNSLYGNYRTRKFTNIYEDYENFKADFDETVFKGCISDTNAELLFYLLFSKFGNSHIANADETQFKYKLFSTIFMYGPSWEKRLEIQKTVRGLTEDDILTGSKTIFNHALNPSTGPSTDTLDEIITIDEQNATKFKRSKLEGYALLMTLIETDVTEQFLDRFKKLFIQIVEPELPLWYIENLEDEDGE